MKFRINIVNEPKNKNAALKLAVILSNAMDSNKVRKENLMISLNQAKEKMTRLQKTVEDLEKQIHEAEATDDLNRETLEGLLNTWQLTQAEILEIKSASLRAELKALEREKITAKQGTKLV